MMAALFESTTRQHVQHGIKVGLASVMAHFLASALDLPYGYWAVITTVIVMQMHVADSLKSSVYRFSGTAIGGAMGIILIVTLPPEPVYTALGILIGTGVCAYLTRYNERFRMAAITVAIVFLTSLGEAHRIQFTLYRVVEIAVGILCAMTVSVLIWPNRTGEKLRGRLRSQFEQAAMHYACILEHFLDRQAKADPDLLFDLEVESRENAELFHKVYAMERRLFREDVALLSIQVNSLRSVLERLQGMLILLNDVEGEGFEIIMAPELSALCQASTDALRALGRGEPHETHGLAAAVVAADERFRALRIQGVTGRFDSRRLFQVLGFISAAQHLGEYLLDVLNKPEVAPGE